ncbi:DnaA N-terminal domain-containing protein [Ammoniphilus sp. CFH 90114]|uniref:DnaA N-terminal domain-containing protein n=1 Tax=Ammoniphilus sp. CFH 90114 TaxID=2493665 RepID=UPI001F0CB1E7|nr:DnaA N-terminal domain-containing protein [Ammoniphilus sp. CFH 90114]
MTQDNLLWSDVLGLLKDRMSKPAFETWFKETKAMIEGNNWIIITPNEFSRDWLESRYLSEIKEAIYSTTKEEANVAVIVENQSVGVSQLDVKIESILTQIEFLTQNEKVKILSLIKDKFTKEIISSKPQCGEQNTENSNYDEPNRISNLEKEVKQLKDELTGLHTEIRLLKKILANQNSGDTQEQG